MTSPPPPSGYLPHSLSAPLLTVIIRITTPAMFVVELVRVRVSSALYVVRYQDWRSQSENGNQLGYHEPASRHRSPCLCDASGIPCETSLLSAAYIQTATEVLGKEVLGTRKFLHARTRGQNRTDYTKAARAWRSASCPQHSRLWSNVHDRDFGKGHRSRLCRIKKTHVVGDLYEAEYWRKSL